MNKTITTISRLTKLFDKVLTQYPIVLVDVGAKGGCKPCWDPVFPYLRVLGFEPDSRSPVGTESWLTVVPIALSNKKGASKLYLTRGRSQSSLFRPNEAWASRVPEGEKLNLVGTETVEVDLLDDQIRMSGFEYVDFLDLNTQASELRILEGGKRTVRENVFGFDVEVNFAPRYHDQPSFGEIDLFAKENGFELFDVKRTYSKRIGGTKTGGRHGQLSHGHALYIASQARFAKLLESVASSEEKQARLVRAIIILTLFGYCDCALETAQAWGRVFSDAKYEGVVETLRGNIEFWARVPNFRGRGRFAALLQNLGELLAPVNSLGISKDKRLGNISGYTRKRKPSKS